MKTTGAWQLAWNSTAMPPNAEEFKRRIMQECGSANDPSHAAAPGSYVDDPDTSNDNRPMTCITWYEAFAFCMFDGGRLPTEAEWNYAAAGGSQQRPFPWAMGPDYPDTRQFRPGFAAVNTNASLPEPVGSFPKGAALFGQHDMAGNAYEWVLDSPPQDADYPPQQSNPVNLCGYSDKIGSVPRVVRGGSFEFRADMARTSVRRIALDLYRFRDLGVRCARPGAN